LSSDTAHVLDNLPATEDIPQWMIDKGKEWTPQLWDALHEIALSNPSVKVRLVATKQIFDRVYESRPFGSGLRVALSTGISC